MGGAETGGADISVVIPTRERFEVLHSTLEALARQRLGGVRAEVVVVDNGSTDGSYERTEEYCRSAAAPTHTRVIREAARGAAAARNAGTAAASAPVVLFLGDDCRPLGEEFLAGHARAHAESAVPRAVVGRIDWDQSIEVSSVMRWLDSTGKMLDYRRLSHEPPGPFLFYTGNTSVDRAALLRAGGFDQRFQGYGWEDYELALRLADGGLEFEYRRELRVGHAHRYGLGDSLRRMHAMGRSAALLNHIHRDRVPLPAPRPAGPKAAAGRALAPVATRASVAERLPDKMAWPWYRIAHYSALAAGYGRAPLPADEEMRGRLPTEPTERAPVSVIVPFHGTGEEARDLLGALGALRLGADDELIVVDNTEDGAVPPSDAARVVRATAERSSYHARNVGAEAARHDWFLFVDSDCRPRPDLIDTILAAPPAAETGAVAGAVVPLAGQEALVARYAASRGHLGQAAHMAHPHRPFAITANLLVRRAAWEDAGGFFESIRSSGDADFSWRIQQLGWRLEYRPEAVVEHRHRERVRALVRQNLRYGAGRAWIARQHEGAFDRPRATRRLLRALAGAGWWSLTLRPERAAFSVLDAIVIVTETVGWTLSNSSSRPEPYVAPTSSGTPIVLVADRFPELSETFVAGELHALLRAGRHVRVEAASRPVRPNRAVLRGLRVDYLSDDGLLRKLGATLALGVRHPVRSVSDAAALRRWRAEEEVRTLRSLAPRVRRIHRAGERHLHAHFADTAALDALRLGRLMRMPFSMSAHAYDIFRDVRNLDAKLGAAAFATGESEYAADYLRSLECEGADVRFLPAGVDGERFRRRSPYPGGRTVVAIGRMVEKKGFGDLVRAAALPEGRQSMERLIIAGSGPLRDALMGMVREERLDGLVEMPGALSHDRVRDLLESADVLAMPSVVARDGDRDSMPNVVYEALAMGVPVVATDAVGLPEVVRPEWGRLVPPSDPAALAAALAEVLELESGERATMGERGREWVLAHRDVDAQAAVLGRWVDAAQGHAVTPRRTPSAQ